MCSKMFGDKAGRILTIFVISSLTLLGACQEEDLQAPARVGDSFYLEIKATLPEARTKTLISDGGDKSAFRFAEGDCLGFYAGEILSNIKLECKDTETGSFSSYFKLENEEQKIYRSNVPYFAYYPYDADAGTNVNALKGELPSIQSAPFDSSADYLVSDVIENVYDIVNFPDLSFLFSHHLFSIVKLSLTNNSEELKDEKIVEIGLKSVGNKLAGAFTFDITNPVESVVWDNNPKKTENRVRVRYAPSEQPSLGIGVTHTVYAVVSAGAYDAGELKLVAETSNYSFSISTISDVVLKRNEVTIFPTVDVSNEEKVFKSTNKFLSFGISDGLNEYPSFDISDSVISIRVPNGTDLKSMVANFTHNGVSVHIGAEEQSSGVGTHDFSDFTAPITYSVTGADGEIRDYLIRLFDLPVVIVDTPTPIDNKYVWTENCSIRIIEADGSVTDFGNEVQVRGRGNSTWGWEKKPYTFKLSSKKPVLGMTADKRWNLLANYDDRTLIRNDVSLEIGRRAEDGLDWTSHGDFVELVMNGEFLGTYYLCEHNQISANRVNITKMNDGDTSAETISGGYLLEYDDKGDLPFFNSSIKKYPISIKSPDDDGFDVQWHWIESYINNLESVLSNPDSLAAHKYLDYMDIDSYVDWWLVYEITGNGYEPSAPRSCYMYKDRGGKMHAGPVWDFDQYTYRASIRGFQVKNALYYKYLFKDPLFVARVKERWVLLKANLADMPDYIDNVINKVSNAALRDKIVLWPSYHNNTNEDNRLPLATAFSQLKATYEARIIELDGLINALVANPVNSDTGNEDFDDQTNPDFGFSF